ncbi:MAG TPA: TspO/MBR family protein [Bacilli bacterium]|nr:TspO/MBR family protein [Bacilli bacterium]
MDVIVFKIVMIIIFLAMILVNYLSNALPLNNRNTGDISDSYPSYFTPPGFVFSIWGIIYVLLGIVVGKIMFTNSVVFFDQYSITFLLLFFITCMTNMLWLFLWHYDKLFFSVMVMIIFLVTLGWITFFLSGLDILTQIAFSVYTGWISIALIANVTALLVKANFPLFQDKKKLWYMVMMVAGVVIGLLVLLITKNIFFILVYIWAYFGIFMKHLKKKSYYLEKNLNVFNGVLLGVLVISAMITFAYKLL